MMLTFARNANDSKSEALMMNATDVFGNLCDAFGVAIEETKNMVMSRVNGIGLFSFAALSKCGLDNVREIYSNEIDQLEAS